MVYKQIAVLGLGRFGQSVVKTLADEGHQVLACDYNHEVVQEMSHFTSNVVQGDLRDENVLESLGLGNFDVVVICLSGNFEASIIATIAAKEKNVKKIIVKSHSSMEKKILLKLGADQVVLPEREMGTRLAYNLISDNVIDYINLSDKYSIVEVKPLTEWIDVELEKSNIRAKFDINVLAIKRNNEIIASPKPKDRILKDDILVVLGDTISIKKLSAKY